MTYRLEHTDTFGGEANYCWVNRAPLPKCKDTDRARVRAAKAWAGWQGLRCDVTEFGDTIQITPHGLCQTLFIIWEDS